MLFRNLPGIFPPTASLSKLPQQGCFLQLLWVSRPNLCCLQPGAIFCLRLWVTVEQVLLKGLPPYTVTKDNRLHRTGESRNSFFIGGYCM